MDMVWNVYRESFNRKEIYVFNVFDYGSFYEDVEELLEQVVSYDSFYDALDHIAMYYFWSKCEHEIVITSFPPYISKDELNRLQSEDADYFNYDVNLRIGKKVDIYQQLRLNWDAFVSYIWTFKK